MVALSAVFHAGLLAAYTAHHPLAGSRISRSAVVMHTGVAHAPAARAAVSRAAIQANLGERFVRLVKANANKLITRAEDPEKILDQAVLDMQKDLVRVRQSYAEVTASQRRVKEQMRAAEDEAQKWYKRAQLALEKGEDELAREALERRRGQDELASSLSDQLTRQESNLSGLYDAMKELESKIGEAKLKKDQYIARARTAKATTKVNDMLSDVGGSSAIGAFDKMKEKVETLEAEAEAQKQMRAISGGSAPGSMEDKFKALESGSSVDDELEKLRASLPSAQKKKELGSGSSE